MKGLGLEAQGSGLRAEADAKHVRAVAMPRFPES